MSKKIFLAAFLLAVTCTSNAQQPSEKIIGRWNEPAVKNQLGIAMNKTWTFYNNGTGNISIFKITLKPTTTCSVEQPFDYTITGDSIKIIPRKATADCTLETENKTEEEKISARTADSYSTTPFTLLLQFEGLKKLQMGSVILAKE